MGKNKLRKFAEMETFSNVFQYPFGVLKTQGGFPHKGRWNEIFGNDNPIVLELGCGKGEYTVGLARNCPDCNFIGIDIKGARMFTGAKQALAENLTNAAFLRTSIELLPHFFAPNEVSEIWITFPDPQMKKVNKRLTGTRFMQTYRQVLKPDGIVHLKTDSPFLYTYTHAMVELNALKVLRDTDDLYADTKTDADSGILPPTAIQTFYEQQWLDRGLTIKYIKFQLDHTTSLAEPDIEIEQDTYRSFSRGYIQGVVEIEENED